MTSYVTLLKESGLKATFQRLHIVEVVDRYGHIGIEGIYDKVTKIHPSLSVATIYKNIIIMVEKGVLVEVPIAGKKSKYELSKLDHMHLICTQCGEVEDLPCIESIDKIFDSLMQKEHFKLFRQQINLYGVCSHCQQLSCQPVD
ncbi:MAG: Fur family transcriptional regulator, peroxide stress response regulator [Campylobacterota bacterium]|nr:Fur family transcriptional regulator, peroxide stress response regulator [Campylobacterota bacterium]